MTKHFEKILIANRGEIAVRVIRACRELGINPVAVYSDVDSKALHVKLAGEAYPLGEAAPAESYLNIDKIIDIAKKSRVGAIHPGYGFLAENPALVRRCEEEKIVFIGPPSEPMQLMGNKVESRLKMAEAGVPIIPGAPAPVMMIFILVFIRFFLVSRNFPQICRTFICQLYLTIKLAILAI